MTQAQVHPGAGGAALAARAGLVAVVVDALRASGTLATLLAHGAERVLVVAEPAEAFALRDALLTSAGDLRPEHILLVGERGGLMVPGCDRGNEPVVGNEVIPPLAIFTSSNCARCCLAARSAPAMLLGHTINATAAATVASALAADLGTAIMLVPAGFADDETRLNLEDTLACGCLMDRGGLSPANDAALAALYAYRHVGPEGLARQFALGAHGRHLLDLGRGDDLRYLAQVDVLDLVPVRVGVAELGGVTYVELAARRASIQSEMAPAATRNTTA